MAVEIKTDLTGAELHIEWLLSGDVTAITMQGMYKKFDPGFDATYEDNTAGADNLETQQKIRDSVAPKLSLAYRIGTAGDTLRDKLYQGARGRLVWGPEGNAAGKPKWGIECEVKKFAPSHEASKLIEIEIEFVNIGSDFVFNAANGDTF